MRRQSGNQPLLPSRAGGKSSKAPPRKIDTITWLIILLVSCCMSFYAGIWLAWTMPAQDCHEGPSSSSASGSSSPSRVLNRSDQSPPDCANLCLNALIGGTGELARKLDGKLDAIIEKATERNCPSNKAGNGASNHATNKRFSKSVSHFANGLVRINRKEMFDAHDFGVPMNGNADVQDVLMLYDSKRALPSDTQIRHAAEHEGEIPCVDAESATANCDTMNVVFIKNPDTGLRQCVALVGGQYQGYHVQRWMRLVGEGPHGKVDRNAPLRVTGRMTRSTGYDELLYPVQKNLLFHHDIMLKYFTNLNTIKLELGSILEKIAIKNTIIVSTVNKGQSELLMNLVCSSRSRGFDLGNLLVFPTDLFSKEVAEGLGIANYYAEKLMDTIPSEEAPRYGDTVFGHIMMAKVICVHLVSELGYDILFQDVDVIWFKDPLKFFHNPKSAIANFDVYFQDDGNRQERYQPYSANSGFYYIRSNERSKLLFRTMMYSGDLIFASRSHQQILITLLAEANSLSGLRVKVLNRDEDDFPGGYHYHMRRNDYMKPFVKGKKDPYIFHMSWTLNKDDKLKFLKQMGMWYVNDECVGKKATDILPGDPGESAVQNIVTTCCSAEPLFTCHYRDKPSIKSCTDSPPKDKNGLSFW